MFRPPIPLKYSIRFQEKCLSPSVFCHIKSSGHISTADFLLQMPRYHTSAISSIHFNSSSVNGAQEIAFILSKICCGLDAPIKTLVTSLCLRVHPSAISASFSPRSPARLLSLRIRSSLCSFSVLSFQNLPSVRIRLSCGIPFK